MEAQPQPLRPTGDHDHPRVSSRCDTVTVTVGGQGSNHVAARTSSRLRSDAAKRDDLIIIDPTCATAAAPTSPGGACTAARLSNTQSRATRKCCWSGSRVRLQASGAASWRSRGSRQCSLISTEIPAGGVVQGHSPHGRGCVALKLKAASSDSSLFG